MSARLRHQLSAVVVLQHAHVMHMECGNAGHGARCLAQHLIINATIWHSLGRLRRTALWTVTARWPPQQQQHANHVATAR
jgi:hypothetical protein